MRTIALPLWVFILMSVAIIALVLVLWSVKRRRRPHLELESDADVDALCPSIAGVTQGTVLDGNRIELLQNGAFWDRVLEDIGRATHTINIEAFLAKEGQLVRRMAEALSGKAREGVEVRLMLDGNGGRRFGRAEIKTMRDAGVHVRKYHPIRVSNIGVLNNRDHRKIIVLDGRIGFVGGHCITDHWLGDAEDKQHYRDISARVEGPVVAQLQSAFAENWIEETGDVPAGEWNFPQLEPVGCVRAHAVWISPAGSPSTLKTLHYMAIHAAQKSITIQNPYFLPDPDARRALLDAARRGVEVRVMIPATDASDSPVVQHASHHHYGTLLKGGVKLFDYEKTLLHQKVIVIDGAWCAVGSTNFDDRSFEVNDEISLAIYDATLARELEEIFEEDLRHAKAVDLDSWKRRPLLHKALDLGAFLFNEQL